MRIRGVTSINASTTPLYILDGTEITSSTFQTLNPNDIESMTVLKDASSTAIYGSRAANGVIILTSKRGRYGQSAEVNVSAQYGISKMTGDHMDMMNAGQWFTLQEMITPGNRTNANFQAMKDYYLRNGISTDWADELFGGSAPTSEINVSATGGSQNLSYLFSYGHYKVSAAGLSASDDRCGANVGLGAQYKVKDRLHFFTEQRFQIMKNYNQSVTVPGLKYTF
jgi:TonB-dependent SusC/RagA subfamily outer membrane receptor